MLTKENIGALKLAENGAIASLINTQKDASSINFILENLGRLPQNFDGAFLYELLNHERSNIRLNAVKNIGKLNGSMKVDILVDLYKKEKDTSVRREIVSSIGRQRNDKNKKVLFRFLKDRDPKIVCQAVRGLLGIGRADQDVKKRLEPLINHPNEMVRTIVSKEYFAKEKTKTSGLGAAQTAPFLKNTAVKGDVCEVLKYVPDESVHLTFTSPPYYNARDYSIYRSYQEYLEFLDEVFKQTHRITKEGRFLIVNTSPIIIPRISRAHSSKRYGIPFDLHSYLMKGGWDFIDDIVWLKPEPSVKNRIGGFMQHRKPLGYKPNAVTEYLMVYRKTTDKLLDWNIRSYDAQTIKESKVKDGYESNNVWKIAPCFNKVHSAVFPIELCQKVIQYYSYKGDLVFDPFAGSGTLGAAANQLGRLFFLTEQNEHYFKRIKIELGEENLFESHPPRFLTLKQFKEITK